MAFGENVERGHICCLKKMLCADLRESEIHVGAVRFWREKANFSSSRGTEGRPINKWPIIIGENVFGLMDWKDILQPKKDGKTQLTSNDIG